MASRASVRKMNPYAAQEAADYLGFTIYALRYHVVQGNLKPTYRLGRVGKGGHGFWMFTKEDLDEFQARKRKTGRPRKCG